MAAHDCEEGRLWVAETDDLRGPDKVGNDFPMGVIGVERVPHPGGLRFEQERRAGTGAVEH